MKIIWPSDRTCRQRSNTRELKGRKNNNYLEIPAYDDDRNDRELQEGKGEMTI